MFVLSEGVYIHGIQIEQTSSYMYLGYEIGIHRDNKIQELVRRIGF